MGIEYHDQKVVITMNNGAENRCVVLSRKLTQQRSHHSVMAMDGQKPPPKQDGPGSWKQYKQLRHEIASGQQVAYRIQLIHKDTDELAAQDVVHIPKESSNKKKLAAVISKRY